MTLTLRQMMRAASVIPVLAIDDPAHAAPLARAIVGVGTLTQPEQFAAARAAGAVFGVSPGLTPALAAAAASSGLAWLPGVMTPSEVMAARELGLRELKLFPVVPAGGVGLLNALYGLPDVVFCPTGGLAQDGAAAFLACPNVACVGGSWLTPRAAVQAGDWGRITELARAASALRARG